MAKRKAAVDSTKARYEFRVWGEYPKAVRRLRKLADESGTETVRDCYLVLADDPTLNAKIRNNLLKVKQLVAERKGFEHWSSERFLSAEAAPAPLDKIFEQLRLDRPQRGKKYHLADEIDGLDSELGVQAVFVEKTRRHYRIGDLRAEVTDIEILETGEVLKTLLIEGDDLDGLKALRKQLGLRGEENVAVHQAVDVGIDD